MATVKPLTCARWATSTSLQITVFLLLFPVRIFNATSDQSHWSPYLNGAGQVWNCLSSSHLKHLRVISSYLIPNQVCVTVGWYQPLPISQIWPLVAIAPPQGILAYFSLIKPQLLCLHQLLPFFIKGINHGDFMEQEKCCSLLVFLLMVLMSLNGCKVQILLWKILIVFLSLFKLGRGYILCGRIFYLFVFNSSSRNSNRMFVEFGKIGPLGIWASRPLLCSYCLLPLALPLTQKQPLDISYLKSFNNPATGSISSLVLQVWKLGLRGFTRLDPNCKAKPKQIWDWNVGMSFSCPVTLLPLLVARPLY